MRGQTAESPPRMHRRYIDEIAPRSSPSSASNALQVPSIEKVVVNIGLGEAITNARAIDVAIIDLKLITGQAPIVIRATEARCGVQAARGNAHRREATLRRPADVRLPRQAAEPSAAAHPRLPRRRSEGIDGHGNFTLGLREQFVFP